jgi:CubicO group peptidase (beta-lactamase class C family)
MKNMFKKTLFVLCWLTFQSYAQITSHEIDQLAEKTLKTFEVPGIAVAVIKDGKVIHAKGYGVRSLNTMQKVDANTLFGIASNSKAFTAAALGLLVEENKLTWETKVTDIIPEFKMYDPYVTAEFNIKDLLTHRSGLGLGAGDLMFWPDSNTFTKAEIIHNLRFLRPVSSFRTQYDYDNLLYIVAGEIVSKVSGMTWEQFITKRFFEPLGINNSAPSFKHLKDKSNVIDPHFHVDGKVQVIRRDWSENANAAGGIYSSVNDMSKWVLALLNNGKYGENLSKTIIKEKTLAELWTPQTIIPVRNPGPYNTHFNSYGLGWFISDVKGYKQITHTGGLAGIVTQTTLIPELGLGILVYTNQQIGAAFNAVTNSIKDAFLGVKGQDRVKEYFERWNKSRIEAAEITEKVNQQIKNQNSTDANIDYILGKYSDPWFGEVEISKKDNNLYFTSKKSLLLHGPISFYKGNSFIVKWIDRSLDADAFLVFNLDKNGQASGFKMEAISPLTDFSFDFQDLDFKRN